MRFGVIVFPGTWSDRDCHYVVDRILCQPVSYVWHRETDLSPYDCVILPGGFSYGDYLRVGAIARFSPVMAAVERFARRGGLVIGICNGFQILCESGLLPGCLMTNNHLQFRCQWVTLRVETGSLPFTSLCHSGQLLRIPISHYDGNYYCDEATLHELKTGERIVFRYCNAQGEPTEEANPNGSLHNIAGITNAEGNVLGMMPHPERACEELIGGTDGNLIFQSLVAHWQQKLCLANTDIRTAR
ncbi:MAG: phosphoribosylformylglycinamidine synthase subunit PurQ [Chloroflexi bacterium]|nr:phosphoribosylformylglycinamidine synthase subunit PurQ [Chloroflexota bacterium]